MNQGAKVMWKNAAAVLTLLVGSGCLSTGPLPIAPLPVCEIPAEPLNVSIESSALTTLSCGPLSFSELRWSSRLKGDVAVEFQFDFGSSNTCQADQAFAGITSHRANTHVIFVDYGDRVAMGGGGPADLAKARVGDLDTSEVPIVSGAWANSNGNKGWNVSGPVTFTFAARDLDPTTPFMPDASVQILWRCERPFALVQVRASREVHIFGPGDFDGGAAAYVHYPVPFSYLETSLEYQGVIEARFDSEAVVLRGTTIQLTAKSMGSLLLRHPTGETAWSLDAPSAIKHDGPPGDYRIEATRAGGGDYDYFGGLLAGLNPIHRLQDLETL